MYTHLFDKQKKNFDNPLLSAKTNLSLLDYKKKKSQMYGLANIQSNLRGIGNSNYDDVRQD